MTLERAKQIIQDNYFMNEDSLCRLLYDECVFSADAFWDFHDAISTVIRSAVKEEILSAQITVGYQRFLKEIIWHFDPRDAAVIKDFPENYMDYVERLDAAVRAYFENKSEWMEDTRFDLKRNTPSDT